MNIKIPKAVGVAVIAAGLIMALLPTNDITGWLFWVLIVAGIVILVLGKRPDKPAAPRQEVEPVKPIALTLQPTAKREDVADHVHGTVKASSVRGKGRLTVSEYIVLDTETTGLSDETDLIIEVAALKVSGDQIVDRYESLVNPHRSIPANITELTGISDKDVQNAPSIDTVLRELAELWPENIPVVAHNAPFDAKFIAAAFSKAGVSREIKYIDTLPLSRDAFPKMEDYKLNTLISELKLLDHSQEHRAMSDVEATYRLYLCCREALADSNSAHHKYPETVRPADICRTVDCIDSSHPLCGKNLVFTGELSIDRKDAMQMAVNVGAVIKSGVSGKTDYLIVGKQDTALVGEDGLSGKEEKAYALNEAGKANIRIIQEDEFLQLINAAAQTK